MKKHSSNLLVWVEPDSRKNLYSKRIFKRKEADASFSVGDRTDKRNWKVGFARLNLGPSALHRTFSMIHETSMRHSKNTRPPDSFLSPWLYPVARFVWPQRVKNTHRCGQANRRFHTNIGALGAFHAREHGPLPTGRCWPGIR